MKPHEDAAAAATAALAKKPEGEGKKPKLKTREIHVRKGHAKGYIAKHHLEDEHGQGHSETHEYPIMSMKDLQAHMAEHMPEEEQEQAQAPAGNGEPPPQQ